ncbi:helix-turn-helix transcriptional regulator [Robbsia andropogonis]|uniref:helix-turn-helix transcriptional regulator n=2 Tax=Robbsia andropogonis TaxID=28092 RepID=UPI0009E40D87|nr:autoinducer binding domain-containing protein [Robbsia andropogonis]
MTTAMDRTTDAAREPLYESVSRINRDAVTIRLFRSQAGLFSIERQLVRADGATLTQLYPVENEQGLHKFLSADPLGDSLQSTFQSLLKHYSDAAREVRAHHAFKAIDMFGEFDRIEACGDETDLLPIVKTVTQALGADQYIFSWLVLDAKTNDVREQRYLVGCHPAWLQKYLDNVWYMNDPLLEYAKRNATPALLSRLRSYNDVHWLEEAAAHGFRNSLVCPVHAGSKSALVMLQVSNGERSVAGDELLWRNRRHLWMLACELLDWHLARLEQLAISQFRLSATELEVLRIVRAGGTAANIAQALRVSVKTVYGVVYPGITAKLGQPNINKAATIAFDNGLLK